MTALRCLVGWPQVLVDVECSLCPCHGRYRLARLAERYGAAMPLARLLELIAADCTLMKPGEKPRHYEARCGVRYVVPPEGWPTAALLTKPAVRGMVGALLPRMSKAR